MDELAQKILKAIEDKPRQLARDLAEQLDVDKKFVNSRLYGQLKGHVFQDKSYRWSLSKGVVAASQAPDELQYQNTDLAKLSRYYLACMGQDEVGVSTFAFSKYGTPDYQELSFLPLNSESLFFQEGARRLLDKVRGERGRWVLYLGYPTALKLLKSSRSDWEGYMVEPVLLFPVEVDATNREPRLDLSYPIINQKVIQAYSSADKEALMEELVQLEEELGIGNVGDSVELDELALRLKAVRPEWPWQEEIDPDQLEANPPLEQTNLSGIFNRSVLIMTERSPFTQGLESELKQLAKLTESEYSGTALGAWITGNVENYREDDLGDELLEVLPMNLEQRQAISSSLNNALTIITGPPGTGKSQVVTNLLINSAWHGKRVLFASKNNKAVDVVETRVNNLGPRPLLLRVGSNAYQTKLAEYLMSLLSVATSRDDIDNFGEAEDIHQRMQLVLKRLDEETDKLISLRNRVDKLEREAEEAREILSDDIVDRLGKVDFTKLLQSLSDFKKALLLADKNNHGFFKRLIWGSAKKPYFSALQQRISSVSGSASLVDVLSPDMEPSDLTLDPWNDFAVVVEQKLNLAAKLKDYLDCLQKLKSSRQLPEISLQKMEVLEKIASNSEMLWRYWLRLQPQKLTQEDRRLLSRYTALLKMVIDTGAEGRLSDNVGRQYRALFPKVSHLLPCWAVTSLSARGKIPMEAGFFDIVVFDEASQCDIASALPLLYRAKKAVVIGDPKQLSHISGLQKGQDQQLLDKFGLTSDYPHWSYSTTSLYELAAGLVSGGQVISLLDHHRSHADIVEFSNKQFYEGRLRVATNYDRLNRVYGSGPGIRWEHVSGRVIRPSSGGAINQQEVDAVIAFLNQLVVERKYEGSIGVVCPFRAQANAIRVAVEKDGNLSAALLDRDFLADTVHRFQGDERDVMIFSPVFSHGISPGAVSFLRNNGNLFNVAITRARAQLIVVGDLYECEKSEIDYLSNFAKYAAKLQNSVDTRSRIKSKDLGETYPEVSNPEQVSDWEKVLYSALYKAGIRAVPQYRVEKYALDFAVFDGDRRLNIEVDGERYHRNWTGELCRRDQIRNQRMFELGWDVIRFWVYEIRDDLDGCVSRIKQWIDG